MSLANQHISEIPIKIKLFDFDFDETINSWPHRYTCKGKLIKFLHLFESTDMMTYFVNNSNCIWKKDFNNFYLLIDTNLSVVELPFAAKKLFRCLNTKFRSFWVAFNCKKLTIISIILSQHKLSQFPNVVNCEKFISVMLFEHKISQFLNYR